METSTLRLAAGSCYLSCVTDEMPRRVVLSLHVLRGALVTQCHTWGPTMLTMCSRGILVARRRDLLIGSAGPLSLASSESRLQGREERGEPPQRWALGLFALCYHLGFDVLFWRRIKRT